MDTLVNKIGTLFLTSNAKTSSSLLESIYHFLFVENIELGIIIIIIVFALLILLFKNAFNLSNKDMDDRNGMKKEAGMESTLTNTITNNQNSSNHITTMKENDYSSDLELVAVLTAAIMAYMGDDAPEDGLIIRSIRKVNRRNHINYYND